MDGFLGMQRSGMVASTTGTGRAVLGSALALVLLAAGWWFVAAADAVTLVKSGFAHGRDHWRVSGDPRNADHTPTHKERGGSPGGYIRIHDSFKGQTLYWVAPEKFRGDQSAAFRGTLKFDLRQSERTRQTDRDDIVLQGGGLRIYKGTRRNPSARPKWTHYEIGLGKRGWRVTRTGPDSHATRSEMKTVLGDLTSLRIRAEYRDGLDVDDLDSVRLRSR